MMAKRLVLERRHFKVLAEVLDIVNASSVPVEELQIVGCTWDYDNLGLWSKCRKGTSREQECPYGCRVPAPPSSLQFADINVPLSGNQAHPLSLALWLSHSRTPSLTVRWSFRFSLFDERRGMTAQVLEVLGPRLIEVSFSAVGPRRWDNNFQDTTFPSLSHNTELKTLNLTYVVPGLCPPNYLASVVSKVSSSGLENLYFRFHVDHKEHLGLEYFDFKALGEVLSPAGFPKFPQLRKLTFCLYLKKELAAQVVSNPPNLRLQQRVFKEIPFLRNWQEGFGLRVDTPTKIV